MQTQPILEEITKVQMKGLVTIPKKLRKTAGITERSLVRMRAQNGKITIEPMYAYPYPIRTFTDEEIQEWLELDKKEGEALRKKGIIK